MEKTMFTAKGNMIAKRVRLGRAIHDPALTQEELARIIQFQGVVTMTKYIITRIETEERRVIDSELRAISQALEVSIDWLLGDTDDPTPTVIRKTKELP